MKLRYLLAGITAMALSTAGLAQESSYTPGTVWTFSQVKIEPGQSENYLDYLAGDWRKSMEIGVKRGSIVSYHIFRVNNTRPGDPDLILAVEYKDYRTTAQADADRKAVLDAMKSDPHKMTAAAGTRSTMRTQMGSMEVQELKLK